MDINITAIERNVRLYGQPILLALLGGAGMYLAGSWDHNASGIKAALGPVMKYGFIGSAALCFAGLIWAAWRAYLEFRWSNGETAGGCNNCGGVMRHLSGRYGGYSKCMMCGRKQEGHH
jgi:hypothetical protein